MKGDYNEDEKVSAGPAILVAAFVTAVFSGVPSTHAAANVFIDEIACGLLDGARNVVNTSDTHTVITNNPNGNTVFRCSANVGPTPTGQAVIWNSANTGEPCDTPGGSTNSWQEFVSASGEATLICHVNPGNP